jgi:2-polyprenyl-3-methyl-5-hydroxy-6-metoxy-1,4-benzoquinol methylase
MAELDYTRRYFSERAPEWLAKAYDKGALPRNYPIGTHRVRIAIDSIIKRIGSTEGQILDLGCGGGDLCVQAASLGFSAVGVDIAESMIKEAQKKVGTLPQEVQARLQFIIGNVLDHPLPSGTFHAVTALGLLEYFPEDRLFFERVYALLRSGGVLVVECRNRLFNMNSLNEYTRKEVEDGFACNLLAEIGALDAEDGFLDLLTEFMQKLKATIPSMEEALAIDAAKQEEDRAAEIQGNFFAQPRRQHTPHELWQVARSVGFDDADFFGVHPHPLPPRLEPIAPRFYNQLASVFQVFETTSVSLVWSSSLIGVFGRH